MASTATADDAIGIWSTSAAPDPVSYVPKMTVQEAREEIRAGLDGIQPPGAFCTWQTMKPSAQNLGLQLTVDGVGPIDFPLKEEQAQQIIGQAKQSPYGGGEETVVDTSVRNMWELDLDQFQLQDTEAATGQKMGWEFVLNAARYRVIKKMGLDCDAASLRVEPYKMLLYEKGAHFKAHSDSPKIPGMFGTLVIVLPSVHEGGELILKHRQQQQVFPSSTWSASMSLMCWYSDVSHEVRPVTSGYRWVLTFNMAISHAVPRPVPTADRLIDDLPGRIVAPLRDWLVHIGDEKKQLRSLEAEQVRLDAIAAEAKQIADANPATPQLASVACQNEEAAFFHRSKVAAYERGGGATLVYRLDHHYTEASLSLLASHGRDSNVILALKAASERLPIAVFLAILENTEEGICLERGPMYHFRKKWRRNEFELDWHAIEDLIDIDFGVKKLVTLDGTPVVDILDLHQEDFLQDDCFLDADGEEIHYEEGEPGISGPRATQVYQVSGVVIVPRSTLPKFLLSSLHVTNFHLEAEAVRDNNYLSLVRFCIRTCVDPSRGDDRSSLNFLHMLCKHVWSIVPQEREPRPPKLDKLSASGLLCTMVRMRDGAFFTTFVNKIDGAFDSAEFFSWISRATDSRDEFYVLPFADVKDQAALALLSIPVLETALAAINIVYPLPSSGEPSAASTENDTDKAEQKEWAAEVFAALLLKHGSKDLSFMDGSALVTCFCNNFGFDRIETRVLPYLKELSKNTSFALGALSAMSVENMPQMALSENSEQWMMVCVSLAESAVDNMDICMLTSVHTISRLLKQSMGPASYNVELRRKVKPVPPTRKMQAAALEPSWLMDLYKRLFELDTPAARTLRMKLSRKIATEISKVERMGGVSKDSNQATQFPMVDLWVPFLSVLAPVIEQHAREGRPKAGSAAADNTNGANDKAVLAPHQHMYVAVLETYLAVCVGPAPVERTPSLARPTMSDCSENCDDCSVVNTFLANGNRRVLRLPFDKHRRRHIHRRLDDNKVDCRHESARHTMRHALVIVKTSNQFWLERHKWPKRKAAAKKTLKQLPRAPLQLILRSEYRRIMSMERITGISGGRAPPQAGVASKRARPSGSGQRTPPFTDWPESILSPPLPARGGNKRVKVVDRTAMMRFVFGS